ncbi:MAG: HAMP domain-containing histidine kinase [Lachnospiraceae bacterium]|nr:HAMP domain-containing histidine kinase [Lachnospiraceae bacterium]
MLQKRMRKSLTAKIFIITTLILLAGGIVTFALLAIVTPDTYSVVINDELDSRVKELTEKFKDVPLSESGPLLDEFIRESGTEAFLLDEEGNYVETGSRLAMRLPDFDVAEDDTPGVPDENDAESSDDELTENIYEISYTYESDSDAEDGFLMNESLLSVEVFFKDSPNPYILTISPHFASENMIVKALAKVAPWLLLIMLAFSLLCSFVYSRYITKPIVLLNDIAGKLAKQDFDWTCDESRQDEIGQLGQSLNTMSHNLSGALNDLKASNAALRGEVEQERELDRQRMAFFSAASHELKTPVTILKGHLSGMLDGIEAYSDRDKYLARCLQVTGRMEKLIGEILSVSGIGRGSNEHDEETSNLSALAKEQCAHVAELAETKGLAIESEFAPDLKVKGDRSLLSKALGNLLSNAVYYTPEGGSIRISTHDGDSHPVLVIENSPAHISEEDLPHLFEAFYREEKSRNRRTGGSGLGLYLVRVIAERYGAECRIENSDKGVRATLVFPVFTQST